MPFLFQDVYGYTAFVAALLFTPWPIGIVLTAPYAGRLADRYRPAAISTTGLGLFTLGLAFLALLPDKAQAWDIGWRCLVCGMGFGIFQSPNNREMLSNVKQIHIGNASGVLAIMRTFGQCLGAAIVSIVLSLYATQAATNGAALAGTAADAQGGALGAVDSRYSRNTGHCNQCQPLAACGAPPVADTQVQPHRARLRPYRGQTNCGKYDKKSGAALVSAVQSGAILKFVKPFR